VNFATPIGYLEPWKRDGIPDGWYPMDGKDGRPDLSHWKMRINPYGPSCIQEMLLDPKEFVICMKDWPAFDRDHPNWKFET
jgi:hypothetical protein